MKSVLGRMWHFLRWPVLIVFVLYIVLVIYRIPAVKNQKATQASVAKIYAQTITLDEVMGKDLPPMPDKAQNDATVAGIDANHNGIRDDVELAIFNTYPKSARIRAAELQYALALQIEMTEVYNTETWVAAAQEDDRGYQCIGQTYPRTDLQKFIAITDTRSDEVKNLVLNTHLRKDAYDKATAFTTSYGIDDTNYCKIDLKSLPD